MIRPRRCNRPPSERLLRWRAPVLTLFLWGCALAWDKTGVLRWGLLAALLHETGHLLAWAALVGGRPQLEISPLGFCLSLRGVCLPPWREKLLAAAGPAANFLLCSGTLFWMDCFGHTYAGYWFSAANLLLGCFNFLPLPGLDGARLFGREP